LGMTNTDDKKNRLSADLYCKFVSELEASGISAYDYVMGGKIGRDGEPSQVMVDTQLTQRLIAHVQDFLDNGGEISWMNYYEIMEVFAEMDGVVDGIALMHNGVVIAPSRETAIICELIEKVIWRYCSLVDGKLQDTEKQVLNLKTSGKDLDCVDNYVMIKAAMSKYGRHNTGEMCMIITKDGKAHYAIGNEHGNLARWLVINGIPLDGAIRFEAEQSTGRFDVNSLYHFYFSADSNDNKLVQLTNEQAETIAALYTSLRTMWSRLNDISLSLRSSQGLGVGINEVDADSRKEHRDIALYNLKHIYYSIPKDIVDKGAQNELMREWNMDNSDYNRILT